MVSAPSALASAAMRVGSRQTAKVSALPSPLLVTKNLVTDFAPPI
jgi:hypothetical protein